MKRLFASLAFLFLLLVSGKAALASTLNGTISFGGAGATVSTGLNFSGSQNVTTSGTGGLSGYAAPHNTAFPTNFTTAGISSPGGEVLFNQHSDDQTTFMQFAVSSEATVNGQLVLYGTLTLYNYTPSHGNVSGVVGSVIGSSAATFAYTQSTATAFSGSLTTTPEPNSLILLGTGLISAAGAMVRRRRRTS